jgi:hypothetical protein
VHDAEGGRGEVRALGYEYVPPTRALAAVPEARMLPPSHGRPEALGVPAGPTRFAPPDVRVVAERTLGAEREIDLELRQGDAYALRLRVPAERLAGWSLSDPLPAPRGRHYDAHFVGAPDSGWRVTLRVRGTAPVTVAAGAIHAATTPAARAVMRRIPPWATVNAIAVEWRTAAY